ncbi:MAG: zinc-ribbon domain and TM2 domain-containing protein [Anaerovibrio sp.]|nr:zinc-ribbon domain and TM2 domain-containing protein [Anaerovibrio sp.]
MSKFCQNCGQQMDDNVDYCPNCGTYSKNIMPAASDNNINQYQNSSQYQSYGAGVPGTAWGLGDDKKLVNKVAYGILAILLGGFGIHKFYAGKTMWGVLYILFCWTGIPAILALVEGIIGLTTHDDGQGNILA